MECFMSIKGRRFKSLDRVPQQGVDWISNYRICGYPIDSLNYMKKRVYGIDQTPQDGRNMGYLDGDS